MGPQSLVALHKLQAVETKLRGLKDQLRRKERQLQQHRLRIKQVEDQLASRQEEIKNRKSQASKLELDFKTKEADIAKLRSQLNIAKNNKEYSAILTQLNTERADNAKLEEKILEELTAIDQSKNSLTDLETKLASQRAELATEEQASLEVRQDLQKQIETLEAERGVVAKDVPLTDLMVFEKVADVHDGEAMAKVVKPTREQEYICDGCNMSIPMEKVNALLTKDQLQVCNICGRILYVESQLSGAGK
jgi:predicted  nucleic acid-binding Zn-ribbon protein